MKHKKKVIILGSGPTGLITAWRLLKKGLNVTIIKRILIQGDCVDPGNIKDLFWTQVHTFFIHLMWS